MTEADKIKELEKKIEALEKGKEKQQAKRSAFLTASGILVIIASCIAMLFGLLYLSIGIQYYGYGYGYNYSYYANALISGILGLLGFSFGLTAGILTLKRSQKILAIFGISFLFASSIASSLIVSNYIEIGSIFTIFMIPISLLSILSLVFLGVAHNNFETNILRNMENEETMPYPTSQEKPPVPINVAHRQSLIASIWRIGVGLALSIIGSQVGSMFIKGSTGNYVGLGILWAGIIILILGVFGFIVSAVMEYF
jgi:hypothetical protein